MKKFLALAVAVVTAFAAVGCSGGKPGSSLDYDFTETDKKVKYTFYSSNWQDYEGSSDRIIEYIEDKFNVEIKITGASGTDWQNRLGAEIADGETPDMFFALPETSTITNYIKKQVITDLNPYIEKANATNLKQIFATEQYKDATLIDGKNYFVPQSVGYTTRILLVRKDWMKKWNESRGKSGDAVYDEPKTLSEFTAMLNFFRNGDPDGDGIKNTYGLALSKNFDLVQDMFATFGVKPDWSFDADGNFTLSALTENYDNVLEWFKNGDQQGYLYPEFYALTDSDAYQSFYHGQSGAVLAVGDTILDGIINEVKKAYPDKNYEDLLTLIAPPDSDDGTYKGAFKSWSFYWGGWCMSADAEEPMRLIKIMDYLFSPEGQKLLVYGIENVHYTETDGVITPNLEQRRNEPANRFNYRNASDRNTPDGRYMLGYQITPCPYKIVDNKLVINYPYDTAADPDLMKLAYDLTVKNQNFSALQKIIFDYDLNEYNTKILDAVETYSVNVISGKNKQSELQNLNDKLTSYKYNEVKKFLNQNAK